LAKSLSAVPRNFRERLPQIQAEAGYWEKRVATVHDFRLMLMTTTRVSFSRSFSMATSNPIPSRANFGNPYVSITNLAQSNGGYERIHHSQGTQQRAASAGSLFFG
jgi:hypothetical protein